MTDDRRYPKRPILGVGAVVLDRDQVLLVQRAGKPLEGWWSLPGGVVETGERLEEGIRREVREETGLEIAVVALVEIFERIIPDAQGVAEYHYVLMDYLCRPLGGTLQAADDAGLAEWVPRRRLSEYRITEGTVPVIEKAFRMRRSRLSPRTGK
ncbi:MAG: NUDIX hydrolase [Bryobacteraceae bacterium]